MREENSNDKMRQAGPVSVARQVRLVFFYASLNGYKVKLLIDTGATLSIISPDILNTVVERTNQNLAKVTQPILTADGTAMKVEGSIIIPLTISSLSFNQKFAVADIGIDGILGLDFMTRNGCIVDISNVCMLVQEKCLKLFFEGKSGCDEVTKRENITVPSCSEIVTKCNVKPPVLKDVSLLDIIEPSDRFLEPWGWLMAKAKTIVTPGQTRRCQCTFVTNTGEAYKNHIQGMFNKNF